MNFYSAADRTKNLGSDFKHKIQCKRQNFDIIISNVDAMYINLVVRLQIVHLIY